MEQDKLTWQDVKRMVNIADAMLDDPEMRRAVQNHSEQDYYEAVLRKFKTGNKR